MPTGTTLVRLFSQTPAALKLPEEYKPFLLLSGSLETTEMQATIKLPHTAFGLGLSQPIGPELLKFPELSSSDGSTVQTGRLQPQGVHRI